MNESFLIKRLHCCLLLMSERRTCADAACVAACRVCRAVLHNTRPTARHNFSIVKIHGLDSVTCRDVTHPVDFGAYRPLEGRLHHSPTAVTHNMCHYLFIYGLWYKYVILIPQSIDTVTHTIRDCKTIKYNFRYVGISKYTIS